jgi:hypothetical protein
MLQSFYKCYISELPNDIYLQCIRNIEQGIIDLCTMIHFSDIPENNNIKLNNSKMQIYIGKKWINRDIDSVIDDMIVDKINILDTFFLNNKLKFTPEERNTYLETIMYLNNYRHYSFYKSNGGKYLYKSIYQSIHDQLTNKYIIN